MNLSRHLFAVLLLGLLPSLAQCGSDREYSSPTPTAGSDGTGATSGAGGGSSGRSGSGTGGRLAPTAGSNGGSATGGQSASTGGSAIGGQSASNGGSDTGGQIGGGGAGDSGVGAVSGAGQQQGGSAGAAVVPEACDDGNKECDGGCIPVAACCTSEECPTGGSCTAGECSCPDGTHECDGACVDDDSIDHCGAACTPCEAPTGGTATCDGTACGTRCPTGEKPCVGECIDEEAACDGVCPGGSHECNGLCIEDDNPTACGPDCMTCPVPANSDATCNGACGFTCKSTFTKCGTGASATCLGLQQDINNCGQCGMACDRTRADSCASGACRCGAGAACAAGQTCCGGTCVDTRTSFTNCGRCGGACGAGTTTCIAGQCSCGTNVGACGAGTTCCGGGCFNTNNDVNHCGSSCNACTQAIPSGAERVCVNGACDDRCPSNRTECPDGCFNTTNDTNHCGSCVHSCKGDTCSGGACRVTKLSNAAAAPYFAEGNPPPRNLSVNYSGQQYFANDAGHLNRADFVELCVPPAAYRPVAEHNADGVAADAQYAYGLFNDGNQNRPYVIRCRTSGAPNLEVIFGDREAPIETPTAAFGVDGGIVDTGDAIYWGVRETTNGPIVVYRLVR